MEISIYKSTFNPIDSVESFLDFYYSLQMHFLASDLLDQGLSPKQISAAVLKAIKATKSSGLEIRKHFMPIFSQRNNEIVNDCKLSRMGYGLVLLNADVELSVVGEWQISVMKAKLD
ncbi:hypothetical protein H2O64_14505 [Kordia sp. YSTF-M3]|uniref:Uncharacterized protein n=1 Tax=Kordia aestuariivivens TaxID=2759037 RepID=A0ABR7QBY5_9FLAO|nr:hypothetical protein [Kordia aestuariivivens]MBC8755886.1 hypothetical protein [Kordia aestuariivivens]